MLDPLILQEPVPYKGGLIKQLLLVEPTAHQLWKAHRHMERSTNRESEFLFAQELVAGVNGVPIEALAELPVYDLETASQAISGIIATRIEAFDPAEVEDEIFLERPVREGQNEWPSIKVRPAKTGEELKARGYLRNGETDAARLQYQMSIVSHTSGIPLPVVYRMEASAVIRAALTVEVFTRRGRATGSS